jgi:hypothetical protein
LTAIAIEVVLFFILDAIEPLNWLSNTSNKYDIQQARCTSLKLIKVCFLYESALHSFVTAWFEIKYFNKNLK